MKKIDPESVNASDIARIFKVTPQAVGMWHKKSGCPRRDNNKYNLIEVCRWWTDNEVHNRAEKMVKEAGGDPLLLGDKTPALEEYRKVRTERERFELETRQGNFYPKEQVDDDWRALGRAIHDITLDLDKIDIEAGRLIRDRLASFQLPD